MHNDCMGLYGNLTTLSSGTNYISHLILGKFFDCNNYEFLDLERPHYFIEKIPTSFEVEKIQAVKQTLVFMSKILKKIFKDGSSQYIFQKFSLF